MGLYKHNPFVPQEKKDRKESAETFQAKEGEATTGQVKRRFVWEFDERPVQATCSSGQVKRRFVWGAHANKLETAHLTDRACKIGAHGGGSRDTDQIEWIEFIEATADLPRGARATVAVRSASWGVSADRKSVV